MMLKKYFSPILLIILVLSIILGTDIACSDINIKDFGSWRFYEHPSSLKFAQLSDIHLDIKSKTKNHRMLGSSVGLFKDAVNQINHINNIDFVIFSGDLINRPRQEDLTEFIKIANNLNYPWYFAFGNHDIGIFSTFNKAKYLKIVEKSNKNITTDRTYYSFSPKKGYLVIVLDPVIDSRITANGYIDRQQLNWLEQELERNSTSKVIIVEHHPIIEPFESKTHKILNSDEYLKILNNHNNVIAVLSGHYHAAKIKQIGNIVFVSTPALVEYPNGFRIITVNSSATKITFKFEFKETGLKDIQQLSKNMSSSSSLAAGNEKDRNTTIVINNFLKND